MESPYFEQPVQNVTVQVGRNAKLTCIVENLGNYKVAWGYKGTGAVLTVSTQVITNNPRISIQREQRSTWVLTIANVTRQDQGHYRCQVNTSPPRSIAGFLAVVEPPVLDGGDEEVTVNRGGSVNLTCRAHGTPTPTVRWIREDYNSIRISEAHFVSDYVGSSLLLQKVTQRSAGGYLCIATNGHPPSISKKIIVNVNYVPEVRGPKPTTWALLGTSVSLTCLFAAHPTPRVVWMRENSLGSQMLNDEYFTVTPQEGHPPYTHNMTLSMRNLVPSDFGIYTCIVRNFLGETQATTTLREVVTTLPSTTTTTATTTAKTTTTTTVPPPPPLVYGDYDDNAKNLTAPLVVNTSPNISNVLPPLWSVAISVTGYSKPSILLFGEHEIPSSEGVQQGDPLAPLFFCLAVRELTSNLRSKLNTWYLDDGILAGTEESLLEDLQLVKTQEEAVGLILNPSNQPGNNLITRNQVIITAVRTILPDPVVGAPLGHQAIETVLKDKLNDLKRMDERLSDLEALDALYLLTRLWRKQYLRLPHHSHGVESTAVTRSSVPLNLALCKERQQQLGGTNTQILHRNFSDRFNTKYIEADKV
ncbi:protein amalgam-like [Cherax quadricarinatus]|uniref:protein amalgam-like n=1 Tax=Cherax quadricarinatus TaxID=27406 RepID=UPI00387EAD69